MTTRPPCTGTTAAGAPCKRYSAVGYDKCLAHLHGRAKGKARINEKQTKVLALVRANGPLARFVTPISEDDPEADFAYSLVMEQRRTIAAIRYYDEVLAALQPDELLFGMTKTVGSESVERIDASEFPGTNIKTMNSTENEAKIHAAEDARRWERKHLHEQHKLWIAAKLDVKRLELEQRQIEQLDTVISAIVTGLGRDVGDPDVRNVVRMSLVGIAV